MQLRTFSCNILSLATRTFILMSISSWNGKNPFNAWNGNNNDNEYSVSPAPFDSPLKINEENTRSLSFIIKSFVSTAFFGAWRVNSPLRVCDTTYLTLSSLHFSSDSNQTWPSLGPMILSQYDRTIPLKGLDWKSSFDRCALLKFEKTTESLKFENIAPVDIHAILNAVLETGAKRVDPVWWKIQER